jgi:N-dimethylarginine dimethylaminohydrolase
MTLNVASPAPATALAGALPVPRRYLMCPPTYFAVRYSINPWMHPAEPVDVLQAIAQWQHLHDTIVGLGHRVDLMPADPNLPDMVFTANGGIVIGDRGLVPRFRHAERDAESDHFARSMRALGLSEVRQARFVNEGEGDFLFAGDRILAGTGLRSDPGAAHEVEAYFSRPVVALQLIDPRFYHLDTALARLDDRTVVYWPGAFSPSSRQLLRDLFPDAILATEQEAAALALNMVSDGSTVIMTTECDELAERIVERGFAVVRVSTSELRKAGGGAKCCVLELHRPPGSPAS